MTRRGFTLIEVLVSVLILAGAMVILSSSWSGSLLAYRKSKVLSDMAFLLKKKMTELEVKYTGKSLEEIPEEEDGDFGKDFPNYRWELKTKKMEFPDLSAVLIQEKADEGGANDLLITVVRQMTEQFSKAIKEAKLTVKTKVGKRELESSITTYFIDYSLPLGVGGGGGG